MPKPILVIDDEEKFAHMLRDILARNGFDADVTLNPQDGLARLSQGNYELVVSDYKMPQMDGGEFLAETRKLYPDLPVIMISGLMNMPELIKVANIGVTLVLEKPFDTDDFLSQVRRFVHPVALDQFETADVPVVSREASEVHYSYESGGRELDLSYPRPTVGLADRSPENQHLLETLWRGFNSSRHLAFYAAKGSEVRLVARELQNWMQADPGQPVPLLDLLDAKSHFLHGGVADATALPSLLMIDVRAMGWNEATRTLLRDWVQHLESLGGAISNVRMVYALPTDCHFEASELGLSRQALDGFCNITPVLLSLRDRISDVAYYVLQELGREVLATLPREALELLLQYPWPGGYTELVTKSKQLRDSATGGTLTSVDVVQLLLLGEDAAGDAVDALDLRSWLIRRQADYLNLLREGREELRDTLLRLGVELPPATMDAVVSGRELAYPGILTEN